MLLLLATLAHAGELARINHGSWNGATTAGPGGTIQKSVNVWVDIAAANVGYGKHVGIRWTDDGWTTSHDAEAWYEASLGGGTEQWGVDIVPMGLWNSDGQSWKYRQYDGDWTVANSVTIEYAIWMTYGAASWWDNNGGADYTLTFTP